MSLFKERRVKFLALAVLVSVMIIWKPWAGLEPRARGLTFGVDTAGGIRGVLLLENYAALGAQDNTISKLQARIDPYSLFGTRFRALGDNYILFETTQLDDRTRELLTKQGRLELYIANELVLTDDDIASFYTPSSVATGYSSIPLAYTSAGAKTLETAGEGKLGLPGVIYLDRPSDAIMIFENGILSKLSKLTYDNAAQAFTCTAEDAYTGGEVYYTLLVPAIESSAEDFSQALENLANQAEAKPRVLLLGNTEDFTDIIENISENFEIESIPQLSGESEDKWIKRACGIISDFPVAGGPWSSRIVVEASLQDARNLYAILSNKSPTELSIVSESEIEARLGTRFGVEIIIAAVIALDVLFMFIYHRYGHLKICLAFVGFTLCELLITLGGASVLGLTLGLPELAGLLLVIGTGINHQLTTTDAVLPGGKLETAGAGWRVSQTLPLIYASLFVTLAAVAPIAALGFGALRGFAAIAITGIILTLLFTRPTYGKVIDAILRSSRASTTQYQNRRR